MKALWTRCAVVILLCTGVAGCGGSNLSANAFDDPGPDDASTSSGDGSSTSETGTTPTDESGVTPGPDGSITPVPDSGVIPIEDVAPPKPDTPSTTPLNLDNVCERLASAVCNETLKSCCGKHSVEFKESGCRAGVIFGCNAEVAEVKAGKGTFNPDAFGPCANAWKALETTCSIPILTFVKTYAACHQLFPGPLATDASCTKDTDCKVAPGAFGSCPASDRRCDSITIVGKDQPCDYSGNVRALCDYGLYCAGGTGGTPRCQTAKTIGTACFGGSDNSCGFGNFCQGGLPGPVGNKCAAGAPVGAACGSDGACASGDCAGGKCTDPNVQLATPGLCNGTPPPT